MLDWIKQNPKETLLIVGAMAGTLVIAFSLGFITGAGVDLNKSLILIKDGLEVSKTVVTQLVEASVNGPLEYGDIVELQAVAEVLQECSDELAKIML